MFSAATILVYSVRQCLPFVRVTAVNDLYPDTLLLLDRYWEVDLWDTLLDELLNVDHREVHMAGTTTILGRLECLFMSYIKGCPQRSRELRELLVRQDNMLLNR